MGEIAAAASQLVAACYTLPQPNILAEPQNIVRSPMKLTLFAVVSERELVEILVSGPRLP